MDTEEARLTQRGAAALAAFFRDDSEGQNILMQDLMDEPRGPEAFLFVAIVAASTWCISTGRPDTFVDELWPHLRPVPEDFAAMADRERITALATATRRGTPDEILAARDRLTDGGVLAASAFDLASASVEALEESTSVPAAEWCQRWAEGTAAGVGVEG